MQKAQLSLEALLLFAIFLFLLAIALAANYQIREMASAKVGSMLARQAFGEFSSKLESACLLGSGNVRTFSSSIGAVSIKKANSSAIQFSVANFSYAAQSSCEIEEASGSAESFTIENVDGKIRIY
jgi:uncharacterized protein (UPF0333 family)